jgi:hypothetical protein
MATVVRAVPRVSLSASEQIEHWRVRRLLMSFRAAKPAGTSGLVSLSSLASVSKNYERLLTVHTAEPGNSMLLSLIGFTLNHNRHRECYGRGCEREPLD